MHSKTGFFNRNVLEREFTLEIQWKGDFTLKNILYIITLS